MKKIRIVVLYGGKSGEHEISLRSAASVIRHLDSNRYEIIPVAIDKEGRWHLNDLSLLKHAQDILPVYKDAPLVTLPPRAEGTEAGLVPLGPGQLNTKGIDVVFPVMHGPLCEDGTLQGMLELAGVPYVGCGVLASAIGMDKGCAKRLVRDAGLPIVPYVELKSGAWERNFQNLCERIEKEFHYPVFVKPSNMGSSVGVHKVKTSAELKAALNDAFQYDTKVLIEKAVDAREIEFAVLENLDPSEPAWVSAPGEVAPSHEFYSYEAKYLDEKGAELMIPAPLSSEQVKIGQKLAQKAFEVLCGEGLSRVDLFLDRKTGEFYFNEVNTLPGFTSISMYPKLWEYSGIPYQELLTRLIDLALARHAKKAKLSRNYLSK